MQSAVQRDHFVNRSGELAAFARSLARAQNADPAVFLIVGEAGIGKSRLVERCCGDLSDATLLFQVSSHEDDHRIGHGLWSVAREVWRRRYHLPSDVADALPDPLKQEKVANSPARDGAILGSVLATAVAELAESSLVVLVTEDLHWADRSTLDFVVDVHDEMIARRRARRPCRLLVVATMRPLEGNGRLDYLLDRIGRTDFGSRVELKSFDDGETLRLIVGLGLGRPNGALLHLLKDTGGNPLEIQVAIEELLTTGVAAQTGPNITLTTSSTTLRPRSLSERVNSRVLSLTSEARQILLYTALLLDRAQLPIIARAMDREASGLLPLLSDALRQRILVAAMESLRFAHPLYRRAVLANASHDERTAVHRNIATAALADPQPMEAGATVWIATHLVASGVVHDAARELDLCRRAGNIAFEVGAYAEASRILEYAIQLSQRVSGLSPLLCAELWFEAGRSHFRNHDHVAASARLDAALELAVHNDWLDLWCEVVLVCNRAHIAFGNADGTRASIRQLLQRLDLDRLEVQARLWSDLAQLSFGDSDHDNGLVEGQRAVELASRTDDNLARAVAEFSLGLNQMGTLQLNAALSSFEASFRFAELTKDKWFAQWGLGRVPIVHFMAGRPESTTSSNARAAEHGLRVKDWSERSLAAAYDVALLALRGEVEALEPAAEEAHTLLLRSQYLWTPPVLHSMVGIARAGVGDRRGSDQCVAALASSNPRAARWLEIAVAVLFRDIERLRVLVDTSRAWTKPITMLTATNACALAHAARLLNARAFAESLWPVLRSAVDMAVVLPSSSPLLLSRACAAAAWASGRTEIASAELREATALAEAMGAGPEAARARVDIAELLAASDPESGALQLSQGIDRARQLGLLPTLEHARAIAVGLGRHDLVRLCDEADPTRSEASERALLVTDIVKSTELLSSLGDSRWVQVRRDHDSILRRCAARAGGQEFAHTGDGIALAFDDVPSALACALEIQRAFEQFRASSGVGVHVRIGIAHGRPQPVEDGDFTGLVVNEVTRVAARADAGEIVVTDAVRARGPEHVAYDLLGSVQLKGFASATELYRVRRVAAGTSDDGS